LVQSAFLQSWPIFGGMTCSEALFRLFAAEAADSVTKVASSIAESAKTKSMVEVSQDCCGWEIHTTVAIDDQHCMKELVDDAITHLQDACRCSRYVCMEDSSCDTWKGVCYGFCVLAFVEDNSHTNEPICALEKCTDPECPKQHSSIIKRLYVMVKVNTVVPTLDFGDNAWDNNTSSFGSATSALKAQSALSIPSAGRAPRAGRMARDDSSINVLFSASVCFLCLLLLFGDQWLLG